MFNFAKAVLGTSPNSSSTSSVSYSIAPPTQLLTEAYSQAQSTFNNIPFSKIAQSAPTFQRLGVSSIIGAGVPADYSLIAGAEGSKIIGSISTSAVGANEVRSVVGNAAQPESTEHIVKLKSLVTEEVVFFDVMPEVSEVRNVEYEALAPPQLPGEFQKYKGTKSVQWTIVGMFTARTQQEAQRNYDFMRMLRVWTMPFFGSRLDPAVNGGVRNDNSSRIGAPPPVLEFSGWRGLAGRVPVVITSLNWNWPKDVDWLPTNTTDFEGQLVPFPAVMTVNINIVETFSADQFNGFDLEAYRRGDMVGAYTPLQPSANRVVSEPAAGAQTVTNGVPTPIPEFWGNEARRNIPSISPQPTINVFDDPTEPESWVK